jgi:hypothetical protein
LLVCWDGLLVCLFVHQMSFDKSEPPFEKKPYALKNIIY